MNVDGRRIADRIISGLKETVDREVLQPVLVVFVCAPTFETEKYLALKKKKAAEVGIVTKIESCEPDSTTEALCKRIIEAAREADGIIVQLPLPAHIDMERVMAAIPPSHDADALNPTTSKLLSPVVEAFQEILRTHMLSVSGKHVVVLGKGRLVGAPAEKWFAKEGAEVKVLTKNTHDIASFTRAADIIVCGAGVPGLLTPDMVRDGAVILDAGTSEEGGELRGDADPRCAEKASLFTPVPGGIGPITIAMLLKNVVDCARAKRSVV